MSRVESWNGFNQFHDTPASWKVGVKIQEETHKLSMPVTPEARKYMFDEPSIPALGGHKGT